MSDPRFETYFGAGTWNLIKPHVSPKGEELLSKAITFVEEDCIPAEAVWHQQLPAHGPERWASIPPILETLKTKAKALGLWNLWLSGGEFQHLARGSGAGITNLEYALIAEISGYSPHLAPQAMNCSAPDTGNMEVIARFGSDRQKDKFLHGLVDGKIRSAFAMTEYGIASSDASNLRNTTAVRKGNKLILNGHKWWISGAGDPRCAVHIVVAVTDPNNADKYKRHSIFIVDTKLPGVEVVRPMTIMGYDDAPEGHCEVIYNNVELDLDDVAGGQQNLGRGFEMLQARLGPGRLHHCMRTIGIAQRSLDLLLLRVSNPQRKTFGKVLAEHGTILQDIAVSRAGIDQGRLITLAAARQIDLYKAKGALKDIGVAKYTVPAMALDVIDKAMQVHGAEGISQDTPLASFWAGVRTLRYADGPDAVHQQQVARVELKKRLPILQQRQETIRQKQKALGVGRGTDHARL
ncbi:hypothetical protein Q8F55_002428 [Vanrija albida]|uniref:Acyl-CoA dehydrogenase n=1 Tax=Vanrija albida TaxID=181172 RepID=A0ABR3Q9Y3_9TREE